MRNLPKKRRIAQKRDQASKSDGEVFSLANTAIQAASIIIPILVSPIEGPGIPLWLVLILAALFCVPLVVVTLLWAYAKLGRGRSIRTRTQLWRKISEAGVSLWLIIATLSALM
ncbi:hypothetical protein [Nonomuraea sp. SBT364]|uniref:hypothetical protein n=1 Tax=Nonomuraea sp. SBT364 TaxID=1580530 RepID=UPI00066EF4B8|nr:hypothetical protein [Nonomuraea sp. SBT364]